MVLDEVKQNPYVEVEDEGKGEEDYDDNDDHEYLMSTMPGSYFHMFLVYMIC
jgi:hypothetical protein